MRPPPVEDIQQGLRHYASELRKTAAAGPYRGFTGADCKLLISTAELFEHAEQSSQKAYRVIERRRKQGDARTSAMLAEMLPTFGRLREAADQIALIAASHANYQLEETLKDRPELLEQVFVEGLRAIARDLARIENSDRTPADVVASAWANFNCVREQLIDGNRALIAKFSDSVCTQHAEVRSITQSKGAEAD